MTEPLHSHIAQQLVRFNFIPPCTTPLSCTVLKAIDRKATANKVLTAQVATPRLQDIRAVIVTTTNNSMDRLLVPTHNFGKLQTALINGNWTSFDLDTVKMLMGIFDTDRKFAGLWKYISDWQNVFRHFDRDRSGSIEGHELAEALQSFGYNLSPPLLTLIEHKYASEPSTGYGPPPGITFDRFVRACVAVKTLTESFQRVDTDRDGWVQMNYEQFMSIVLSAP
ncbi:hypothetical protein D9615_001648 [Tricholomella constricta]|uniref:EF-hand domain-containing protein n=1 Tax=Tricholomella constricta TaxID=117010 RepID=A0A8H5HP96_9AGAR|nr:hypothetical protein D9615_001648 [Tricholomella constricta]